MYIILLTTFVFVDVSYSLTKTTERFNVSIIDAANPSDGYNVSLPSAGTK